MEINRDKAFEPSAEPSGDSFFVPDVLGADHRVPILGGAMIRQVFLDNAASTKPFRAVSTFLRDMEGYYSNIHRGSGFDAAFCTRRYEEARAIVRDFVGGDSERDIVIPVRNTTEGLNMLAKTFEFTREDVVVTTILEHHSNDLPWRGEATVKYVGRREDGLLDLDQFAQVLADNAERLKVVAVTGASNVTGEVLPIHRIAAMAHEHGAMMVVDAAQLAPHRKIRMRPHEDPGHLDFVVLSAHKMNSPYGEGAIVGRRDHFAEAAPYLMGGGTVYSVSLDHVIWADPPDRQEAGTPNILGLFALAAAIRLYERIGMDEVAAHEAALTRRLLSGMRRLAKVWIMGLSNPDALEDRLGVVTFAVEGLHHNLVAAILACEYGISVRSGCFCAHPLIKSFLEVSPDQEREFEQRIRLGDRSDVPGGVRVSIGLHNTAEDVDRFLLALEVIADGTWKGEYAQNIVSGEYGPKGFAFGFGNCPDFPG